MENEKANKKQNVWLIILFIIILIAGCVIFFLLGQKHANMEFNDNKNNNIVENTNVIESNKYEYKELYKFDISKKGNQIIDIDGKNNITIMYENDTVEFVYNALSSATEKPIILKKISALEAVDSIYIIDDLLLFQIVGSDGSSTLSYVDFNGNTIKDIKGFNDDLTITVGNKVKVKDNIATILIDYGYIGPSIIEDDNLDVNDGDIVEAELIIEYSDNHIFNISLANEKTYKEWKNTSN